MTLPRLLVLEHASGGKGVLLTVSDPSCAGDQVRRGLFLALTAPHGSGVLSLRLPLGVHLGPTSQATSIGVGGRLANLSGRSAPGGDRPTIRNPPGCWANPITPRSVATAQQ